MKIVVTGSLGHISQPLTKLLLQKGHTVTVISSKQERQKDIEALGAKAAIGSVEDLDFLTNTFTGADAVYTMLPGGEFFFDQQFDPYAYAQKVANNLKDAIKQSHIKKVIHLSSIGGHMDKNNGLLLFHFQAENILSGLPDEVAIKIMRPVGFYYNMFAFIPTIKTQGTIISNYNATYKEPWVSPADIAAVIAEEFDTPFAGRTIRYIASDELTGDEVAKTLGASIGQPELTWTAISNEQMLSGMLSVGMNPTVAKGLVEMNAARQTGELFEDYFRNKPVVSPTKLVDFAKDFAAAYNKS